MEWKRAHHTRKWPDCDAIVVAVPRTMASERLFRGATLFNVICVALELWDLIFTQIGFLRISYSLIRTVRGGRPGPIFSDFSLLAN